MPITKERDTIQKTPTAQQNKPLIRLEVLEVLEERSPHHLELYP